MMIWMQHLPGQVLGSFHSMRQNARFSILAGTPCNPEHSYMMRGAQLEKTHMEKDLAIYIDSDLKFQRQAASAASKATQILSQICRSIELHDCVPLPLLYKSLVRPHLEYGNTIWGPFNNADQRTMKMSRGEQLG